MCEFDTPTLQQELNRIALAPVEGCETCETRWTAAFVVVCCEKVFLIESIAVRTNAVIECNGNELRDLFDMHREGVAAWRKLVHGLAYTEYEGGEVYGVCVVVVTK